jgi:hypothetical protein
MALPPIDFNAIASTAKDALEAYGTPAEFFEGNAATGRAIKAVIYNVDDDAEILVQDADTQTATAILNPDDFLSPNRMPRRFDKIKVSTGGFIRTYTIDAVNPILAQATLPLLLVQLRAN